MGLAAQASGAIMGAQFLASILSLVRFVIGDEIMDKWEFYQDPKGEWRWRRTAPNGKVVGSSTEGYKNRADCVANARRNGYTGS